MRRRRLGIIKITKTKLF